MFCFCSVVFFSGGFVLCFFVVVVVVVVQWGLFLFFLWALFCKLLFFCSAGFVLFSVGFVQF